MATPFLVLLYIGAIINIHLFYKIVTYPRDLDLSNPASVGLYATRSFHLNVPDADVEEDDAENKRYVRIGLWHVLPKHVAKRFSKELQLSEVSTG